MGDWHSCILFKVWINKGGNKSSIIVQTIDKKNRTNARNGESNIRPTIYQPMSGIWVTL